MRGFSDYISFSCSPPLFFTFFYFFYFFYLLLVPSGVVAPGWFSAGAVLLVCAFAHFDVRIWEGQMGAVDGWWWALRVVCVALV